jgi:hypothetical protein
MPFTVVGVSTGVGRYHSYYRKWTPTPRPSGRLVIGCKEIPYSVVRAIPLPGAGGYTAFMGRPPAEWLLQTLGAP